MSRASSPLLVATAAALITLGARGLGQPGAGGIAVSPAWEPPPSANEPPPGGPEYTMTITLGGDHRTIDGEAVIRWTNTSSAAVGELWWHLYMNAFSGADTLFMRTGGAEGHRGHSPGDAGRIELRALRTEAGDDLLAQATHDPAVERDATQLRTPLRDAVPPGGSVTVRASFRTVLPAAFARTGFWRDFAFAGQWFPKVAVLEPDGTWAHFPFHAHTEFYADFGRYDVTLDVPAGDVVGATGVEVSLAPGAPRGRHRFVATRVHDFAWTAWSAFVERRERIAGVDVRVLHGPGMVEIARRGLAGLRAAMPLFAARFGAYPYPNLTVVVPPPQAGGVDGMEYPTLITTGGEWYLPRAIHDAEYVAIHEFAHQYFYGLLASNEWRWPFLDEGFAEYATGVALAGLFGAGRELADLDVGRIGFWAYQGGFAGMMAPSLPIARGAAEFPSYGSYGGHVYRRTATVLRTAELSFGAAGVRRALQLYTARARFRHPTPDDLLDSFRDAMGTAVADGFLRPAILADASLDYSVGEVTTASTGHGGYVGRVEVRHEGGVAVPVEIELEGDDGERTFTPWDGSGPTFVVPYAGRSPLRAAWVDRAGRVPLDRDRTNNARLRPGAATSTLPLAARLAFWFGAALRAVGP